MNRLLRVVLTALAAVVMSVPIHATAVPGPDTDIGPAVEFFDINVNEILAAPLPHDLYSSTRFLTADGWDFGDRHAYHCAWVEFFRDGAVLFEVHYELVADYPVPVEINDRNGWELADPEIAPLCGDGVGPGENSAPLHDGSDHFPHGTALDFYLNDAQIATIDYGLVEPGGCDRGYWTPGDEPGEAWLWWDEDGPLNDGHHDLDCGGGAGEPVAVVRAYVQHMTPGVGVCTEDSLDGDQCTGVTSPPPGPSPIEEHASTVTLRLRGHIRASGHVGVADATTACMEDRIVVIQRRASGDWKKVGKDRTTGDGHYMLQLRPRDGRYRSRVLEATLANGDICEAATSQRRVYLGG